MTDDQQNLHPISIPADSGHPFVAIDNWQVGKAVRLPPPVVHITGADGKPLVSIHPDGRTEFGDGYTPDEAAMAFWDAVERLVPPAMVREYGAPLTARINAELAAGAEAQKKVERLDEMATAWKERLPETISRDTVVEAVHLVTRKQIGR